MRSGMKNLVSLRAESGASAIQSLCLGKPQPELHGSACAAAVCWVNLGQTLVTYV